MAHTDERERLAKKEGSPYFETSIAREIAFRNGWNACIEHVLAMLTENYKASKQLTDFDKVRPAQEILIETYEDLISILNPTQP